MTVSYSPDVANASFFCMFWKVMKIYRGSIYKIIWRDLIFFIVIFLTLQFASLFFFSESQQLTFRQLRDSFYIKRKSIPLHFVLGFFVVLVVDRWRFLHLSIPSADTFSLLLNAAISDDSEGSRLMRRAAVRYVIASFIINIRTLSVKMRNRFPTLESIVNLGILLNNEKEILEKIEENTLVTSYVIPLVWATNIINRARKEGLINNDCIVQDLVTELGSYRRKLGDLLSYDLVCIPLFYIQVVTLTIYSYYFTTIIGYQVCRDNGLSIIEIAESLMSASLEFIFHVGWVKVAEVLINPFGEDDEDFEVHLSVDRNLKAANMIVDYMRVKEVKKPVNHTYDYPIYGYKQNTEQALYEEIDESSNITENHLYCSVEADFRTQTEDKYFQIYENVTVTSPPLQLQPPSQTSSNADYVNIYESILTDELNSGSDARKLEETNIYEEIPVATATLRPKNLPQRSSDAHYVHIYDSVPIEEFSSESDAKKRKQTNIYDKFPVAPAALHQKNLPQRSSDANYFHIYDSVPIDEVSSESDAKRLEETNIYEEVPVAPATLHQKNLPQRSSDANYVHIYDSVPIDEVSSESDAKRLEETNIYEEVPVAPATLHQQNLPQRPSDANYVHIYDSVPIDEVSSESDAKRLEETNIYEEVPVAPATLHQQNLPQSSSYVDYVHVIVKNKCNDEITSSDSDDDNKLTRTEIYENVRAAPVPLQQETPSRSPLCVENVNVIYDNNSTISTSSGARPLLESDNYENVTPKQKKSSKRFSFPKFKLFRKK